MTLPFRRIALIVLDSVGIGAAEDAHLFGDEGSDTIGNIYKSVGLELPNLCRLGLGEITSLPSCKVKGAYGKMREESAGKDTTSGHWEIAGVPVETPFKTYPQGFPQEIIEKFENAVGRETLWNQPASGTEIIARLGEKHEETGKLIVYTSADSVFQIAAHEEIIPPAELYEICQKARELLVGEYQVARVIARPFVGSGGDYTRTANRRDFSLEPPDPTLLDKLLEKGFPVIAVGKIADIFAHRGITYSTKTKDNRDGVYRTIEALKGLEVPGLIFTNLIDFDSLYGHRRNPEGYKKALEEFDKLLPEITAHLEDDDLLIITADHGNDPTFTGTDHTRENTPLLAYHHNISPLSLKTRSTFADIGKTIGHNFSLSLPRGQSFLSSLR